MTSQEARRTVINEGPSCVQKEQDQERLGTPRFHEGCFLAIPKLSTLAKRLTVGDMRGSEREREREREYVCVCVSE